MAPPALERSCVPVSLVGEAEQIYQAIQIHLLTSHITYNFICGLNEGFMNLRIKSMGGILPLEIQLKRLSTDLYILLSIMPNSIKSDD